MTDHGNVTELPEHLKPPCPRGCVDVEGCGCEWNQECEEAVVDGPSGLRSERLTFADAVHEIRDKLVELQNAPHEEHPGAACPICVLTNRMLAHLREQSDA